MQKEKPKRKTSRNHVEFVSPLPMSECIKRIETVFKQQGCVWILLSNIRLKFVPVDADKCEFYINKQSTVEVRGKLIYQSDTSTFVVCQTNFSQNMQGLFIVSTLGEIMFFILTIATRDVSGIASMIFWGLILFFSVYQANRMRDSLLNDLKLILLYK